MLIISAFVGKILVLTLGGCLAGVIAANSVRDTIPREHDAEREVRRLTRRLRHPIRAWLGRLLHG